jgi:phospholipid-binding lipoprotein MlaA
MFYRLLIILLGAWYPVAQAQSNGTSPQQFLRPAPSAAVLAGDPFESVNRSIFEFNERVDRAVIRPLAEAYVETVPTPIREGISNVLTNFDDAVSALNHALQGKPVKAASSLARVVLNSTVGIAGLRDPATTMGFVREAEDLGQTLAVWGFPSGPYLVLPFLGPSTVLDAGARIAFFPYTPIRQINPSGLRYALIASGVLTTRAELLQTSRAAQLVVFDRYLFARDGFLQRRRNQIYDGDPPDG